MSFPFLPAYIMKGILHMATLFMKTTVSILRAVVLLAALMAGLWATHHSFVRSWRMGDWSDATRQWEVCQYVKARINPYELASRLLRNTYGPATGPDRILLREHRIYSISSSNWKGDPSILPGHPPPEATYPPSTLSMLVPTIGFLPKPLLLPVYTTANIVFLALLLGLLAKWFSKETLWNPWISLGWVAALCLLWPPLQQVIQNGQAGILALLCAWAAMTRLDRSPQTAGVLLMVSLIKPSMVLLFFIIPLIRGRWKTLWTVFLLASGLTLFPSFWLREWPWVLLSQWMELCRYVLQGAFTLQEVFNALAWENTWRSTVAVFLLGCAVLTWCLAHRRARGEDLFAFLCLANLSWTYHERHDFVLLVVLPVLFTARLARSPQNKIAWIGLGLCGVLGLALTNAFYIPTEIWAQAARWAGRASLAGLWGVTAYAVHRSHLDSTPRVA